MCSYSDKDGAEEALNAARSLAAEGKFEQALEKQVWFHNHALEVNPSYYGVRLSYALSDWIQLGEKYPAALAKLKGIRDEKTSRLLAAEKDRQIFNDVVRINDHLNESEATVGLFKKLDVTQSDFAGSVYDLADEALVAAREYNLAKKYLGDPKARLEIATRNFDEGMEYARRSQRGDASRKAFERIFTAEILRIINVLDQAGSQETAREIQSKALATLDTPAIRDVIGK